MQTKRRKQNRKCNKSRKQKAGGLFDVDECYLPPADLLKKYSLYDLVKLRTECCKKMKCGNIDNALRQMLPEAMEDEMKESAITLIENKIANTKNCKSLDDLDFITKEEANDLKENCCSSSLFSLFGSDVKEKCEKLNNKKSFVKSLYEDLVLTEDMDDFLNFETNKQLSDTQKNAIVRNAFLDNETEGLIRDTRLSAIVRNNYLDKETEDLIRDTQKDAIIKNKKRVKVVPKPPQGPEPIAENAINAIRDQSKIIDRLEKELQETQDELYDTEEKVKKTKRAYNSIYQDLQKCLNKDKKKVFTKPRLFTAKGGKKRRLHKTIRFKK